VTEEAHLDDGWEPGLETDTLLRAATEAWIADAARVARSMGGRVDDQGDVVLVDTGFPSLLTASAFLRGSVPAQRIGDAVTGWFPGAFAVVSPVPTADLGPLGLSLVGHPPFMVRPAGGGPTEGTRPVQEVTDAAGLAAWERCFVEGFPLPDGGTSWTPGAVVDERVLGEAGRYWVGRDDDGRVVTCSAACVHAGVVEVTYVATMPGARGRGWGAAATWAATLLDPALPAVLVASDDGRPVYERMGFLAVSRWTMWAGGT
jgi:GNAT superfamily N-acetyltransferase